MDAHLWENLLAKGYTKTGVQVKREYDKIRKKKLGSNAVLRLKIKEIAELQNINQGKLSRLSDVGYSTIRRIFDDPCYSVNFSTLERIAKALGVRALELLEEIPDNEEKNEGNKEEQAN